MNPPNTFYNSDRTPAAPARLFVARHSLTVRITHWINALCFSLLLMSGLQIFNAHPRLYWGAYGADTDQAFIAIGAEGQAEQRRGYFRIGPITIASAGLLGTSREDNEVTERAFPAWITLPSYNDLAAGRHWHLFFAWVLFFNGLVYLAHGVACGHIRRDLLPSKDQWSVRHVWHELIDHARLRFAKVEPQCATTHCRR